MTSLLPVFALAIALAMDAFAVALTQGARFRPGWVQGASIAITFGVFQGIMPLIGWVIGANALTYVEAFDHWIAFALLAYIGIQMIRGASDDDSPPSALTGTALFFAGLATSIDALAAGITLPTLSVEPLLACVLIAGVTALLSALAVWIGRRSGDWLGRRAEILGGAVLIAIGGSIVLQHLSA